MPVGDFPTVFPTIMTCWLSRMVTSENGIIHRYTYALYILHICTCTYILDVSKRGVLGSADDDIAFFLHTLSIFIDVFFADHEHVFLANTCKNCKFKFTIYNTMLHVFCISWHCLLFMKRFVCNLRAYICSTWKTRDGRKCINNFGVLAVSGLNK